MLEAETNFSMTVTNTKPGPGLLTLISAMFIEHTYLQELLSRSPAVHKRDQIVDFIWITL